MADYTAKMIGALDMLDTDITDTARRKWLELTFGITKSEADEIVLKWHDMKEKRDANLHASR